MMGITEPGYSTCGPWTRSIAITWKLLRNAESQVPRFTDPKLALKKKNSQAIQMHTEV